MSFCSGHMAPMVGLSRRQPSLNFPTGHPPSLCWAPTQATAKHCCLQTICQVTADPQQSSHLGHEILSKASGLFQEASGSAQEGQIYIVLLIFPLGHRKLKGKDSLNSKTLWMQKRNVLQHHVIVQESRSSSRSPHSSWEKYTSRPQRPQGLSQRAIARLLPPVVGRARMDQGQCQPVSGGPTATTGQQGQCSPLVISKKR